MSRYFGITARIKVPSGTRAIYVGDLSEFETEVELLFGRGSTIKVTRTRYSEKIKVGGVDREWEFVDFEVVIP